MSELSWAILILIITLVAHFLEEIKTDFRRRLPLGEMSKAVFVAVNLILYPFCLATFACAVLGIPAAVPMARIFSGAMLLNGIGHIGIMTIRRAYFPGGITAFFLVPLSLHVMMVLATKR